MSILLSHGPYFFCNALICMALFGLFYFKDLFKKLVCLSVLQTGTIIFFVVLGKVSNGTIPILNCVGQGKCVSVSDPIPQVLMLTAIVVGVATLSVGLSIAIKIKRSFNVSEEMEQ